MVFLSFSSKVKAEIQRFFGENRDCRNMSGSVIIEKPNKNRIYLRTAFLEAGSVNGTDKAYHLEFIVNDENQHIKLIKILKGFGLTPKTTSRSGKSIIYFKDGNQIAEILNIIGAHKSLMEFENTRAKKEIGNSINRLANCEAANIDKSISAAVKHREDIELIIEKMGLESLDSQLYECAILRLNNPELSLFEIGQKLSPPIGKSGVSHRFRKIAAIAENIK